MSVEDPLTADVVVVGSGAAGLTCAIALSETLSVLVLSKAGISAGSTAWAQGGIAAVLDEGDTFEAHIEDTMIAGAGLNDRRIVEFVVEQAPAAIERLAALGVPFTPGETVSERFHLTREGGHRARRIVHVDDATGWAVQKALERAALENPRIRVMTDQVAIDIATERHAEGHGFAERRAHGLYALDRASGRVRRILARAVVLATGGASRVYRFSTNPDGSTGDGIAMAWRAGCRVSNMEFNQFHPTCLYNFQVKNFLITEAMRGEGGILRTPDGRRFMPDHDPRAELAPRDIVARAIDAEMKRAGLDFVHLDMTHLPEGFVESHFPTIVERLRALGIDPVTEPIPVVPAAHYTCGGVLVDRHGRTDLPGLYAIGEVSQSGLHGANRMASNSLLECLVFGASAADDILARFAETPPPPAIRPWDESRVTDSDEEVVVSHNWAELRRFMWNYVGIVRTDRRLERAARRVELLREEVDHYYGRFRVTPNLLELRNVVEVADLIVRSAQSRKESRGLHYTTDYPGLSDPPRDTILYPSRA
ncbi:MAG: L-aspartate oxidase [Thermaurantiacus tibetensis]|uniref:L-aspartate oxidase n=1 Tax=Thermaurantiacus tibetensis TaxID=2759035 RepID=UPI00188E7903|nr:L-aspartate oxidase [Thermaurantiacus tibetensis]